MTTLDYVDEIAGSARELLEREVPRDAILTRLRGEDMSTKTWKAAAEVGWFRILTAPDAGGLGAGPAEIAALFREIGRFLPAGPFIEDVVAAGLLRNGTHIGPDELVVTLGRVLGGRADFVEHADVSDLLLIVMDVDGDVTIASTDAKQSSLVVKRLQSFDLVGRPCSIELRDAHLEVLCDGAEASALVAKVDLLSAVAGMGTVAGLSAEILDMSVQYAKDRVQFDRPIGSFQAVQHRLAEMAVTLAAIDRSLDAAAKLTGGDEIDRLVQVRALHAFAAGLGRDIAESALQVHGGIGFTDEHRLHVYLKRALRLQAVAEATGDPLCALGGHLLAGTA